MKIFLALISLGLGCLDFELRIYFKPKTRYYVISTFRQVVVQINFEVFSWLQSEILAEVILKFSLNVFNNRASQKALGLKFQVSKLTITAAKAQIRN